MNNDVNETEQATTIILAAMMVGFKAVVKAILLEKPIKAKKIIKEMSEDLDKAMDEMVKEWQ